MITHFNERRTKKKKNWEQEIKILEQEIKKPTKAEFYKNLKNIKKNNSNKIIAVLVK